MAYIGKPPSTKFSAAAKQDSFTGDGSTTTFDVANIIPAGGENSLQVFVDNVRQKPGSSNAYTIGNDGSGDLKRITFTAAPDASAEIYVITPFEATNIKNIGDGTVTTAKMADDAITSAKIADSTITSAKITDGAILNADVNASAAIVDTKLAEVTTAGKVNISSLSAPGSSSVFLRGDRSYATIDTSGIDTNAFNISLLGFKMAVNEGLTVFNLVDGIVDEFHDESGTDEGEGSNDTYCATNDYYINSTNPTGLDINPGSSTSAGFSTTAITEPDTSTVGGNPAHGTISIAEYTTPENSSQINVFVWGAGGGGADHSGNGSSDEALGGGGGGFVSGTLAVTGDQKFDVIVAEGGSGDESPLFEARAGFGGGINQTSGESVPCAGNGGGMGGVFADGISLANDETNPTGKAPQIYFVAGAGGGGGGHHPSGSQPIFFNGAYWNGSTGYGGSGGGLTGAAGGTDKAQTDSIVSGGTGGSVASPATIPSTIGHFNAGGGDQEQGGQGAPGTQGTGEPGGFLYGGPNVGPDNNKGSGGSGYYGGGGGGYSPKPQSGNRGGGGGSSYYGHPQVTCGSTEAGNAFGEGGGVADPAYVACTNEGHGGDGSGPVQGTAENGYVLITRTSSSAPTTSTTIMSEPFASTSVPTTSRIVVFEERLTSLTLNTDLIASVSRDGGSNFTTATLTDSGYVTGSSGQRILTGQATISGQPSGQSMRWKLALANNRVKIHGVSLQWA